MYEGKDIVDIAMEKKGQRYVFGAPVHLANRDWAGPWDCAEFASWACYHACHSLIGVRPPDVRAGNAYSGWWHDDAVRLGGLIETRRAIATPGAILLRRPGDFGRKVGHVAIARGDGTTIEAHSEAVGVAVVARAAARPWTGGFLVPGVLYATPAKLPRITAPQDLLELRSPYMRGPQVEAIQRALLEQGVHPGPVDGVYGPATADAVAAFQLREGLVVDGVVGPETRKRLGLG